MAFDKKIHSSIFGYKKAEVIAYVEEYSRKAENEVNRYKKDAEHTALQLAETKKELAEKKKEIEQLLAEVENLKNEQERIKAEYDAIKQNEKIISDTLIESRRRADEVVTDAKSKADEVLTDAKKQADGMISKTQMDCDEKRRMANIDLDAAKNKIKRLQGELHSMKLDVLAAMEKYKHELENIALAHEEN